MKMDDIGLRLAQRATQATRRLGRSLVTAMPKVLAALSVIGTIAMLWVGGHILLLGTDTLGWHWPYGLIHSAEESVRAATGAFGGPLAWLVNTLASAVIGLTVGTAVALAQAGLRRLPGLNQRRGPETGG